MCLGSQESCANQNSLMYCIDDLPGRLETGHDLHAPQPANPSMMMIFNCGIWLLVPFVSLTIIKLDLLRTVYSIDRYKLQTSLERTVAS